MEAPADIMNILVMVIVGGIAGTLAARIMRGTNFGLIINVLLGIAGAIVGGFLFNLVGLTPGKNIVKVVSDTFGVDLPLNIVGMIVSATVGAIIIIWLFGMLKGRRNRA
jgi:uncharacterized membrane protein YeaQ/YmgE (transglycosylase-associated protein family)